MPLCLTFYIRSVDFLVRTTPGLGSHRGTGPGTGLTLSCRKLRQLLFCRQNHVLRL